VKRQVPDGSEQNNRLNHISYSNGGSYMTTLASLEIIINGEQNCLLNDASPRDTLTTFIFTEEAAFITGNCRGHLEDITGHVTEKEN
jgi:hypothetical protein